ncbi:hypothetical protein HU200_046180 [Digitaria exilis]|uniref:F-box domain-containing protein n=1 Tax=Digitaria exilis TaxID=1010633 RepID=A0A835B6A4_9POAL|nr:hypothetical protein HU200_046180 [Digitaria exilis]
MCCLSPSPSASATSSRRGQILAAEWPPGSSSSSNPHSDGPPSRTVDTDDEEFGGRPAKRVRLESGCGDGVCAADRPPEDGRDRISDLPDAVLLSILSVLPLRDAGRCSVLATRWRRLFPLTLLDFHVSFPGRRLSVFDLVSSILGAHPEAPVRSFRTSSGSIRGDEDPSSDGGGWLQELGRHGVQELFLSFSERWQRIPSSLFACASLTRLRATCCTFPSPPDEAAAAGSPLLTRLTEIELWDVEVPEDALHALLSHCTALERLKMRRMRQLCGRVRIRSPSLKILRNDGHFDELFVEDAPNLEWLLGDSLYQRGSREVRLKIAHAPKLKFLGYLGMNMKAIEIGETIFKEDQINLKTLMPSLKTLAVEVSYTREGYIDWITQLLNLFPCLEALYIRYVCCVLQSDTWSRFQAAASETWDVLRHIPCVHNHLEKVVFEVYRGHDWQREMAKFLHGRSRFLKDMEFHCKRERERDAKLPNVEWVRKQQGLLCLDSRASKDARLLFFSGMLVSNHWDVCHHEWYKRKYYDEICEV